MVLIPRAATAKAKATARSQKQRKTTKSETVKEEPPAGQAAASSSGAGAAAASARRPKVEKPKNSKKKYPRRKAGSKPWLKRTIARPSDYTSRAWMYRAVWEGRFKKTSGGLTAKDLKQNRRGRIVPKRRSEQSRRNAEKNGFAANWRAWIQSVKRAREELGITQGFVLVKKNGTAQEASLYTRTVENWAETRVRLTNEALAKAGSASRIVYNAAGCAPPPPTPPTSSAPPAAVVAVTSSAPPAAVVAVAE